MVRHCQKWWARINRGPDELKRKRKELIVSSQKHKKHDASEKSSSNSDSFNDSDHTRKRREKKSHRKTDKKKLCASLAETFLTVEENVKTVIVEEPKKWV